MQLTPRRVSILSNIFVYTSLILYLSSWVLPCIVTGHTVVVGSSLFIFGWIGIVGGILAWYANPSYIYSIFKVSSSGGAPIIPPLIASLFALSFVFQTELPSFDGRVFVDGYGIGYVFWMLSMPLPAFASLLKRHNTKYDCIRLRFLFREVGGLLCVFIFVGFLAGIIGTAIYQRHTAGVLSRKVLEKAIIVRSNFSTLENAIPDARIVLDGPLEIVLPDYAPNDSWVNPPNVLTDPPTLLSWGIPVVRLDGYDYRLRDPADAASWESRKASGEPAALLHVDGRRERDEQIITARLSSGNGRLVAFYASWICMFERYYDPEFYINPSPDEPPRSLLLQALELPEGAPFIPAGPGKSYTDQYDFLKVAPENIDSSEVTPCSVSSNPQAKDNCQHFAQNGRWKFQSTAQTGEVGRYVAGGGDRLAVACDGEYEYLLFETVHNIKIHKRRISDFREEWDYLVSIDIQPPPDCRSGVLLNEPMRISETDRTLHVALPYLMNDLKQIRWQRFDVDLGRGEMVANKSNPDGLYSKTKGQP